MLKYDKFYTFLLSHSKKSKVYIKRFEVSKNFVHFGSLGLFLFLGVGILSIGISNLVNSTVLAETISKTSLLTKISAEPRVTAAMDHTQPAVSAEFAVNSGGPADDLEEDGENAELDNQLRDGILSGRYKKFNKLTGEASPVSVLNFL